MASKKSLDSMPDEILQNTVEQVAGAIEYNDDLRGYTRDLLGNRCLRDLRLVNRRISSIARRELYRIPSSMSSLQKTGHQLCLSSDHLHILFHPLLEKAARLLSLAGTSAFFAGILETRFLNLTSLTLVFSKDSGGDCLVASGSRGGTSLAVLGKALQTVPLRNLSIHFREDFRSSRYEFFQIVSLAAGHPKLQSLAIDPAPRAWSDETDSLIVDTYAVTSIRSIDLGSSFHAAIKIIQSSLGSMPDLSRLSVDTRHRSNSPVTIFSALSAASRQSVTSLDFQMTDLHAELWEALASLPNLQTLELRELANSISGELGEVVLPKLETIFVDCRYDLSVACIILEQAAQRHLLPSMTEISILGDNSGSMRPDDEMIEDQEGFLEAYDELAALKTGIEIWPPDIRDAVAQSLKDLHSKGVQDLAPSD